MNSQIACFHSKLLSQKLRWFWSIFEVKLYSEKDSTLLSHQIAKHIACIVNYYCKKLEKNSPGSVVLEHF